MRLWFAPSTKKRTSRASGRGHPPRCPFSWDLSWFASVVQIERGASQLQGLICLPGIVSALPPNVETPAYGLEPALKRSENLPCSRALTREAYFYFATFLRRVDSNDGSRHLLSRHEVRRRHRAAKHLPPLQFHPEKSGDSGARVLQNFPEAPRMSLAHRIIPCL